MAGRLQLHNELVSIVGHAYYQPPESVIMIYPCCVYKLDSANTKHADNKPYFHIPLWELEIIHEDPDEDWIEQMLSHFERITFVRRFTMNNLHHEVFRLYY